MISGQEALARLKEGNRRFVDDERKSTSRPRPSAAVSAQEPFAIILGCSDSRVPAEIVFDQGLGDLFVIRVAGNIVAPSLVGSVEFATEQFGTRLVVVLGHSQCGAVQATLDELVQPTATQSPNFRAIVNRIRPAVKPLLEQASEQSPEVFLHAAVRANIASSVSNLGHDSQIIERLVQTDGLMVVGAEYSLETGLVDFFDDEPVQTQ